MKYPIGAEFTFKLNPDISGKVTTPERLREVLGYDKFVTPADVCVEWSTGDASTYDEWWIDEHTESKPLNAPTVAKEDE